MIMIQKYSLKSVTIKRPKEPKQKNLLWVINYISKSVNSYSQPYLGRTLWICSCQLLFILFCSLLFVQNNISLWNMFLIVHFQYEIISWVITLTMGNIFIKRGQKLLIWLHVLMIDQTEWPHIESMHAYITPMYYHFHLKNCKGPECISQKWVHGFKSLLR